MKSENAIEIRNLTKKFKVYYDKGNQLKERLLFQKRNRYEERQVLDGISFDVKKGEAIGLIGHNGCGKSTTLKLLSKIIYPNAGSIEMCGRVSSLIELGAGFHPDMSGRENIYINAAIFGLTRKEIDSRVDDIIAFSELEEFIDAPVRTYSSGMYMRLAFSVAINVDADILLIDEILAVGDAGFQAKCYNRLREIKASGTTIVIVSHSMGQIEQICDTSIWIYEGRIRSIGKPKDVNIEYLDYMSEQQESIAEKEEMRKKGAGAEKVEKEEDGSVDEERERIKRWGNGKIRIEKVHLMKEDGADGISFKTNKALAIKIDYKVNEVVKSAVFGVGIFRIDGVQCYGTNTRIDQIENFDIEKDGAVIFKIPSMNLLPGSYLLDVAIECDFGIPVDYYKEACRFDVYSSIEDVGIVRLDHQWIFDEK